MFKANSTWWGPPFTIELFLQHAYSNSKSYYIITIAMINVHN